MAITEINYTILSDYCLLDGRIMYSYRWNPKFQKNMIPSSSE